MQGGSQPNISRIAITILLLWFSQLATGVTLRASQPKLPLRQKLILREQDIRRRELNLPIDQLRTEGGPHPHE